MNLRPLDGRRWRDLVQPIDALDGSVVAGATLIHFDANGRRHDARLDEFVLEHDLERGALVALDHDQYCPRFLRAAQLAEPRDMARRVSLHPAGELRIEFEDRNAALPAPLSFSIQDPRVWQEPATLDPHLANLGLDQQAAMVPIQVACRGLRDLIDREHDDTWRAARVAELLGREALAPLLELDGPPVVGGFTTVAFTTSSLPVAVRDLPVGALLGIEREQQRVPGFHVGVATPQERSGLEWDNTYVWFGGEVERSTPLVVLVRLGGHAVLRGRIPASSRAGVARLDRRFGEDQLQRVGNDTLDESNTFVFGELMPGVYVVCCEWAQRSGELTHAWREVDVPAGSDVDVGLLTALDGPALTIAPQVLVDGTRDETLFGGALAGAEWVVTVSDAERTSAGQDPIHRFVVRHGFEPFTLVGNERHRYELEFAPIVYPATAGTNLRVMRWPWKLGVDLSAGDVTVEPTLELASTVPCEVVVHVPAAGVGYERSLRARAFDAATGTSVQLEFEDASTQVLDEPWHQTARVLLPPGTWSVVAVSTTRRSQLDKIEHPSDFRDHVGRGELVVTEDAPARIEFDLGAASSVRAPLAFFNGEAGTVPFVDLQLAGEQQAAAGLWGSWGLGGEPVELHGLFPDTEYVVSGSGKRITTGAAGTVLELMD